MTSKKKTTQAKPKDVVTLKDVPVKEANDNPTETIPVAAAVPETPTVQAQVSPQEAKIGPVQPEPPSASDVAEALDVKPKEGPFHGINSPNLHTITAADLEQHPELVKEHKYKEGDQIGYGSTWVWKYPTADRTSVVQEQWPRDIGQSAKGITINP
jgi:hypothetical protein